MLEMLTGLLQFNPQKRFTVEECLKLPLFDDIRMPTLEQPAKDVHINLDVDAENAFDWGSFTD